jgi:hypothetical protein
LAVRAIHAPRLVASQPPRELPGADLQAGLPLDLKPGQLIRLTVHPA